MPYKIRTKLIIAFLGLVFVLLSVTGIVAYYNQTASRKTFQQVEEISKEVKITGDLQLIIERILMPANDYIITGNRKYIDDFKKDAKELEKLLTDAEAIIIKMEKVTPDLIAKERKILNDVKIAWQNIKDISNKIFAITSPVGNMEAARLMEEMDYKWGKPAADGIHRWHEGDYTEYEAAIYSAKNVWLRSWIIMGIGAFMLIGLGIVFALFYTRIFVRPITVIHNGADKIAHGDFKTRLDIKTGDEIEDLSDAMNEMAAQLDSMYSNMQAMVDERTAELKALLNASQSVLKYRGFIDRAKVIFDAAKELIGATGGYVALMSEDGARNEVLFLDSGGRECTVDPSLPMPIRGLREQAYKTGLPVYENNFSNSEWIGFMPKGHVTIDNVLFAPLMAGGKAIGLIGLANKPGGFNDNDARVLSGFGDIASIALLEGMASEALQESEEKFKTMIESANDMIWMIDTEGRFTYINKQAEDVGGYNAEEVIGKHYSVFIHPDDLPMREEFFRRTIAGEKTQFIVRAYGKDDGGRILILQINSAPIYKKGKVAGIVNFGRDITEMKKAEDALKQRIDELEQFRKVTIKRELKMEEMRKRIEELEGRLGIKGV